MNSLYPSRRAVIAVSLGIPLALLATLAAPASWIAGPAWAGLVLAAMLADWVLGAGKADITSRFPPSLGVGRPSPAQFSLGFAGAAPATLQIRLEGNDRLAIADGPQLRAANRVEAEFLLTPLRRGEGRLSALWLRWTGPLGLIWIQRAQNLSRAIPIIPDIKSVRDEAARLFRRGTDAGLHSRLDRGLGTEFHALRDFQRGHDPRQIDWKQSARHNSLIVKEFRVEQNQHIVAMLDTGRIMSEPMRGQPRLDHALHAILLLFYVGLKLGDRVALSAFDSRPRLSSGSVSGAAAFPALQRLAASLDYSTEETNFTFGITQLAADLEHHSVIFIFTDFADSTSAEQMLENVGRLLRRHQVIFILFRDEELETMRAGEPLRASDASRAVVAESLLTERALVLNRLTQMGAQIIDTSIDAMSGGVLNAYLALKQRVRL